MCPWQSKRVRSKTENEGDMAGSGARLGEHLDGGPLTNLGRGGRRAGSDIQRPAACRSVGLRSRRSTEIVLDQASINYGKAINQYRKVLP